MTNDHRLLQLTTCPQALATYPRSAAPCLAVLRAAYPRASRTARDLGCHFGDVACDLAHSSAVTVAGGNDGDLVHVSERRGQRFHDFRQARKQLVKDRGLVVLLKCSALTFMALASASPFLKDDFRLGFSLGANRRRVAFGFRDQALLFGGGQGFDALALDLGAFNTVAISSFSRREISAS